MHYFFLGNTPALSRLEVETLVGDKLDPITDSIMSLEAEIDATALGYKLGGTRKISHELSVVATDTLEQELIKTVSSDALGKNVAITSYFPKDSLTLSLINLKKSVSLTRPIRLVSMDTAEHELIMLSHQHVSEFNLIPVGDGLTSISKTVWIYDAEDWIARDRRKPYRDIKRGMLPPKVARIMVNLATRGKSGLTLADPFCGTGTVLTEAVLVGQNVIGSDTNPEAVKGSETNLAWIASTPNLKIVNCKLLLADATHFHEAVASCDCIATEPYMGPLLDDRNPSSLNRLKNVAKGLDKLYRGAFKSFHASLPHGGRVVMSIPSFHVYGRVIDTISIDTLASLGYNYIDSIAYGKPGATVVRNITILEKK